MTTLLMALGVLCACTALRWYLDRPSRKRRRGRWIELDALWNSGGAFGLPIPRILYTVGAAVGLALLWRQRKRAPLSVGLILGGGASNLLERLGQGRVYDYLRFPRVPFGLGRFVYNLADLALFAGIAGLLCARRSKPH